MYRIESGLFETPLGRLRPTQMTVGHAEVEDKRKSWNKLGARARRRAMAEELFPVVRGPGGQYYLLDHHHTAVALAHEKADRVQAGLVKDLSALTTAAFWTFLDHYRWAHPYDHRGRRRRFEDMPTRLADLRDDPYRSLAGAVRDAGGFAKSDEPFLEFLWADFLRGAVAARPLRSNPEKALKAALELAHTASASHLPGWCGKR